MSDSCVKVLFLCVENSRRSQMAEGFARVFGAGVVEASSAGSRPSGVVDPLALKVMSEIDIDISGQHSKGFDQLGSGQFDIVVSMGCGDECPVVPAMRRFEWDIEDPKGRDEHFFRTARNQIRRHVMALIQTLGKGEVMERHFDEELSGLKCTVLRMAGEVEQSIRISVDALAALDITAAKKVIEADKAVDELEVEIDEKCVDLLARFQPMAGDLRFLTMTMGITTDLERIADLSVDISQRVLELAGKPLLKPLVDIPKLTAIACEMVKDAVDAFVNCDAQLAKQVILRDKEADDLRNRIADELTNDYMAKDPQTVPRALPLLLIARHLERICDHATNVAEEVIYMVQAKMVRHHPENLQ